MSVGPASNLNFPPRLDGWAALSGTAPTDSPPNVEQPQGLPASSASTDGPVSERATTLRAAPQDADAMRQADATDAQPRASTLTATAGPRCAAAAEPLTRVQKALLLAQRAAASLAVPEKKLRRDDAAQRTVVKLRIDALKPHPRQAETFSDVSDEQIEILARDMEENGLEHPIEVLPDGTIIAGHCRVEAARRNGWDEIDAIIRHDLAEQGELAVEQYMVKDNFLRRQLSPLQRARSALLLRELAQRRRNEGGQLDRYERAVIRESTCLRDEIGGMLGLSGREVSRLLRVLETPPEVQAAFDAGYLSLVLADKIAGLDDVKQKTLAQAIRGADDTTAVAQRFIAEADGKPVAVMPVYRKLLKAVSSAIEVLSDRIDEIEVRDAQVAEHVETLRRAEPLFRQLIDHEQATRQRREENMERMLGRLANLGEAGN